MAPSWWVEEHLIPIPRSRFREGKVPAFALTTLDPALARQLARIVLGHVRREYPSKLDHVLDGPEDLQSPRALHPVFFGSFDWHSCVHGWWTLLTLRRLFPESEESRVIARLADESFTPEGIAGELAYLARPAAATFERPYGWAWLLRLHREALRHDDAVWCERLTPLALDIAERLGRYLDLLTYPIRTGTHANTAFAMTLALDWADTCEPTLAAAIRIKAQGWFTLDRDHRDGEPGGEAFLSPALIEALCMKHCLAWSEFTDWLAGFLPQLGESRPAALFAPAFVSDRADGRIVHLDGLNLSRAWCWRALAPSLAGAERDAAERAAARHLTAALPHLAGDYAGEHWLASFALLALGAGNDG